MTEPTTFKAHPWQQSSEPFLSVDCQEQDCWPVDNRSESGTKDQLEPGLHPVVAIGSRTAGEGRPLNKVGVVVSYAGTGTGTATDRVEVNIAEGTIVRQWVSNILTYNAGAPLAYEQTPVVGQPVFVDDSADLSAGVTLSMSPLNYAVEKNPMAGVLWYCQDEIADGLAAGSRATATFDTSLPNAKTEQEFCVLLCQTAQSIA
jgi:hypothetical protein